MHLEYVRRNLHRIEVPLVMQRADPEWLTATLANHYAHSVTGLIISWLQRPAPHPLAGFLGLTYELMPRWQRRLVGLD